MRHVILENPIVLISHRLEIIVSDESHKRAAAVLFCFFWGVTFFLNDTL